MIIRDEEILEVLKNINEETNRYKHALDEIYQYVFNEHMSHLAVGQEAKYLDINIIFKIFKKAGYKI